MAESVPNINVNVTIIIFCFPGKFISQEDISVSANVDRTITSSPTLQTFGGIFDIKSCFNMMTFNC